MKTSTKILLGLVTVVLVMIIGIPTRVIFTNVDNETFDDIKNARQILSGTKKIISKDSIAFSPLAGDEFGYIDSEAKVDRLFPFLKIEEREKIKALIKSGQVENIDIMRPKCIRFTLKESYKNYFITSSYERLELVFNDGCVCTCEDMRMDEELVTKEKLGDGWFKVSIVTMRTKPHA